jgi:hypothetical protein
MFSRVRVVTGLLCVLALFALLQLFSSAHRRGTLCTAAALPQPP